MEKRNRSRGSSRDSERERGTSKRHLGGHRCRERWERGERVKKDGDRCLGVQKRSKTTSRVEQFSFTEEQWKQVDKGPERGSSLGRRSRTVGRAISRERIESKTTVFRRSNRVGWQLLENRPGGIVCTQ